MTVDIIWLIVGVAAALLIGVPTGFLVRKHIAEGKIPEEGQGCRVYDAPGRFIMTGKAGQLDRGGEAVFCDKTFFNRD